MIFLSRFGLSLITGLFLSVFIVGCSQQVQQGAPGENSVASAPTLPANTGKVESGQSEQARQLLDQVATTYKGMKSFSENFELKSSDGTVIKEKVMFARPNRLWLTMTSADTSMMAVSNGKVLYARNQKDYNQYLKTDAPSDLDTLMQMLQRKGVAVGFGTASLLNGESLLRLIEPHIKSLIVGESSTINGVPVETVIAECEIEEEKLTMTFVIGRDDHLLYEKTTLLTNKDKKLTISEKHSNVKANPAIPASAFVFKPPVAARAVRTFLPSNADPRLVEGSRPFSFSATDHKGKPISLDQYKGKVLLLDFWATWCGPCIAVLPELKALHKKYSREEFDILGISLDEDPAQFNQFITEQQMTWRHIYSGQGWQDKLPRQYGVTGIPYTLLIGRDGKIIGANLMAAEIEAAIRQENQKARG